ncbi:MULTISPECIES: hypothetical protein [Faecalibacterium]|uniref:Uncharacterized protein n=2 Tax=Faecalibacterium duncaniae (strain DSM 17677 / JCM 31915 / A2-165) TaxID=411483 RepID=C7HAU1_FAED2|nr:MULTISPECIES: hypothetical protein [Faecalibacterium]EEU94984.1 hypothetical protein FAEPRAA2165_03450 [Faecalibacterium duncaniae]MBO1309507.1 hypothetical protein [Faecalibacterium sp. Marseille-Q4164]MDV5057202.1 hypothetical protein [Faecalibacterium duncaniae]PDX65308.1 hypothetical protein CGS53_14990 [Faecalibacterium prausnitzii]PDX77111.1 hypothetical protein CGS57_15075 [Faecalibacterium prausnitzii]
MTNKKFKLAAMSLATAVAVSTVGPSASAVTYYLGGGSVTVDQDKNRGAFSYQGEDKGDENRTYVNDEKAKTGDGTIYVQDGHAPTTDNSDNGTEVPIPTDNDTQSTDASGNNTENSSTSETTTTNTITVKEDVTGATIVVDGVNVDITSTPAEVPADAKEDKTIIKVGEGADVDLTVKDSNLTTGGNGIDIGVNLEGKDENKETNVDLTLDNTKINLTEKDNTAGIVARDNSTVDVTLKGKNTIDGKEALENAAQEAEAAKEKGKSSPNRNVEGIRVGGENAGDDSSGEGASLTIKGDVTSDQGSLNIDHTSTGMVISNDSDVTLTDNADVDIKHTEAGSSTQGGRGIVQRGDLTVEDKSSLTIDTVGSGAYKIDNDQEGLVYGNNGYGIDSTDDITVTGDSTLEIKGTQSSAIYGGTGSSLTVEDSTLNIDSNGRGIDYEGGAGDITFDNSEVNISGNGMGISVAPEGGTNITFDNSTGSVSAQNGTAIYGPESNGKGKLTVTNKSEVKLEAPTGIYAGFDEVEISGKSKVTSIGSVGMMFVGGQSGATKLHVTGESEYNLQMKGYAHALRVNLSKNPSRILVDQNSKLHLSQATTGASAIVLGNGATLTMDNGTLITEGNFRKGSIYSLGTNSTTTIKNGSHVDVNSIVGTKNDKGQKLIVTGGTLTYDYKADNTLWPVNDQGDKLTNFLLTKDDAHANFDALSYKGQTYTYLSDLNKETGKQYLSVWVPAAALNYMLDVDGSHDPEIIGKALEELKQAGYNFDTAYQTAENGDQVVILRDMVVNGKSLNFTKTTDAEGNTKLIWGNYEKQAEGAPSAYDMVYGTEYEYEGKTYTIVWGYESQNNPNTTAAAGVLDAFGPDSNVKVTGENIDGTDSAKYTVTIYGALREVTDPVIPTNPKPETPEDSDPTPPAPAPTTPTTPAVQDARPTTPAVEQAVAKTTPAPETPVNPPVQDARPESGKLIQTGTTNWMADVLVRAGGVLLAAGYLLERKRKSMFHKAQH